MIFKPLETQLEWAWVAERAYTMLNSDVCGIVVLNDVGVIQAVAVFDNFTRNACSVHFAIDNPMVIKHGFINEIARYLFNVRGRTRIFGLVPADNTRALKFDKHLGMKEVTRIPNALDEGLDYVVLSMTKEECRWLAPEQKQEAA